MVLKFVLLLTLVAAATARRSPYADYVESLFKSPEGSRYSDNIKEDSLLDVPGLVAKYGYPIEVHDVITEDGYILEMHRIPHGRDNNNTPDSNKPVVLLMHGMFSSSADFLVLGPGSALGYLLAEAGYDVWIGNARGNYYSRRHRTLNPDSNLNQDFWKFSWDEIGNYDLPALIDRILETTQQSKLHYIGHSQGGTAFLVLNSLRPEYNKKFISFQALAPGCYFVYNEKAIYRTLSPYENVIESTAFSLGLGEIVRKRPYVDWVETNFCNQNSIFALLCKSAVNGISQMGNFNSTMVPLFLSHAPAGSSVRQVAHYAQVIRFQAFRRFNHNAIRNLAVYGRLTPPEYDLSKVTVPAYLHYGLSDEEAHYKDVLLLGNTLPNTVGTFQVPRETFNHLDFIWAMDAKEGLYDNIMQLMAQAENER